MRVGLPYQSPFAVKHFENIIRAPSVVNGSVLRIILRERLILFTQTGPEDGFGKKERVMPSEMGIRLFAGQD